MMSDAAAAPRHTVIKIIVLGAANVGKTAIVERYVSSSFTGRRQATVGCSFQTKLLEIHDQTVVLQLWDTAGQERFHSATLGAAFYRGAHGAMLVYDVTNRSSIRQLAQWRDEAVSKIDADVFFPIVVIGNKLDLKQAAGSSSSSSSSSSKRYDGERDGDSSGDDEKADDPDHDDERTTWMDNPGVPGSSDERDADDDGAEGVKDSQQTVLQWCRDNAYGHLETSAKDDTGIAAAMQTIAALALEAYKTNPKNGEAFRRLNRDQARRLIDLNHMYAPKPNSWMDAGCGCTM